MHNCTAEEAVVNVKAEGPRKSASVLYPPVGLMINEALVDGCNERYMIQRIGQNVKTAFNHPIMYD